MLVHLAKSYSSVVHNHNPGSERLTARLVVFSTNQSVTVVVAPRTLYIL